MVRGCNSRGARAVAAVQSPAVPLAGDAGPAQRIGALSARRSKKRAQVALNLSRITGLPADSPEVQELVVEAFRSYARYWLETFALVREGREFFLDRFRSDDLVELTRKRCGCGRTCPWAGT